MKRADHTARARGWRCRDRQDAAAIDLHHTCPEGRSRRFRHRIQVPALLLAALLTYAFCPPVAWAGCGVSDFSACADDAQYTIWYGVAAFLWAVNAMLLQMAYLIDVLRVWLIETACTSAYQALVALIDPLIVPFATIALMIAVLLLLLLPIFGRIRWMSIRHVLSWALLAPLLLTVSGPLIVQVEQVRTQLGSAIFTQVGAIAPGAIFGVRATDMPAPAPLYGGDPCGTGALSRPGSGTPPNAMHMDDLAAALLWANAQDIHCPTFSGEGQDLPDAFFVEQPDGPGFAATRKVGEMNDSSERAAAIQNIQRGVTRLGLGLLPSLLAVLEMLVNLVFGLALVALWIGLPLALAFIFFEESAGSVAILLRQGFSVLKVSWASSVLMAILFAALTSSAEMGNATAYTGLAAGSILLMAWMLFTAFATLGGSIRALNRSVTAGTGLNAAQPFELAAGAAGLAAGALSGGAALALTSAAAYQQSGSGRYAAGAALGRVAALAQVGEVAAAMGLMHDTEAIAGLNAGQRSHRGMRTMRLQMVADAQRRGADGVTIRACAQERGLARQLDAATTDRWRSIDEGAAAAGAAMSRTAAYARSGQALTDVRATGGRMLERIGDRWDDIRQQAADVGMEIQTRSATRPGPLAGAVALARGHAAVLAVAHDRLSPDRRYDAYRLDPQGKLRAESPRAAAALPPDALTAPTAAANIPRLLRMGYTIQQRQDGMLTFWQTDPQPAATAALTPETQLQQLSAAGALNAEETRAAAPTLANGGRPIGGERDRAPGPTRAAREAGPTPPSPAAPRRVRRAQAGRNTPAPAQPLDPATLPSAAPHPAGRGGDPVVSASSGAASSRQRRSPAERAGDPVVSAAQPDHGTDTPASARPAATDTPSS